MYLLKKVIIFWGIRAVPPPHPPSEQHPHLPFIGFPFSDFSILHAVTRFPIPTSCTDCSPECGLAYPFTYPSQIQSHSSIISRESSVGILISVNHFPITVNPQRIRTSTTPSTSTYPPDTPAHPPEVGYSFREINIL